MTRLIINTTNTSHYRYYPRLWLIATSIHSDNLRQRRRDNS